MPPPQGLTICPTLFDVRVLVDPLDAIGKDIYYYGVYEAGTLCVLRDFLHDGDVFVEVGAYVGFHTCVIANFVGKNGFVHAIEPNPKSYKTLVANIKLNKLTNVFPLEVALGSEESMTRIYNYNETDMGVASLICPQGTSEESGKPVRISTIDALIGNKQLRTPTFIKIDVEGYELEVLKGAKNLLASDNAPMLCVEYSNLHPQYRGSPRDIYRFIKSVNNYSFYKLKYGKGGPSKLVRISREQELPYHDNVFCFLARHLTK